MIKNVTPSEMLFQLIEYFSEAKRTGALKGDEFSKIQITLGNIYANLVRRGLRTEEQAENFLDQIPNGKWPCYSFPNKNQEIAHNTVKQDINTALYEQEKLAMQFQSVRRI